MALRMKCAWIRSDSCWPTTSAGPYDVYIENRRHGHSPSVDAMGPPTRLPGMCRRAAVPSKHEMRWTMADQHNMFISHRGEDDALVGQLKQLLAKNGAEVRDSSITSENPNQAKSEAYIKQILADRITWAGKVIVIISPDTKDHAWVSWEIEYANRFPDKRIIGVWAPGAAGVDMPAELDEYADAVVGWDSDAIIGALNGADNWQGPGGETVPPRSIKRLSC
jgi:hypothetical protein